MTNNSLHNNGDCPLSVPGFRDLPIYLELGGGERFAHGSNDNNSPDNLTARELAMMRILDSITDKHDWHITVFDDDIVAKWCSEALRMPLISPRAWDWCLLELRDKAAFFQKTGRILVFNTSSGICKSDTLVAPELRAELKENVAPLLALPDAKKDWHPTFDQQVLDLVHASLFPLVYGRSMVLMDGGEVDLDGFLNFYGRGALSPTQPEDCLDGNAMGRREKNRAIKPSWTYSTLQLWSRRFQWLPCEVKFTGDYGTGV